jgi:hypothetical protein
VQGTLACLVVLILAALLAVLLACGGEGRGKPWCIRVPLVRRSCRSTLARCCAAAQHRCSFSPWLALSSWWVLLPR